MTDKEEIKKLKEDIEALKESTRFTDTRFNTVADRLDNIEANIRRFKEIEKTDEAEGEEAGE